MKKILLGTSAIVALGAISTEAFAADKIALGLGGFHKQYVTYSNHDDSPKSMRLGQQANNEIYVNGSTTLDNGVTVGVRTEFEANGEDTGNGTDRVFMTIGSDAMGTVRLGVAAHMMDDFAVRAPMVGPADWGDIGGYVAWEAVAAAAGNVSPDPAGFGDNAIKMGYHTPTFNGVTGYASYGVAEGSDANNGRKLNRSTSHDSATFGLAYEGEMGGASIAADIGYGYAASAGSHGTAIVNDGFTAVRAGLNVGMSGFTVGGSYTDVDGDVVATATTSDLSGNAWELGVGYETGPYSIAAAYLNSNATATTTAGDDEWTAWTLGAGYDLGAGVGLVAQYVNAEFDNEGTGVGTKTSASSIIAGIEVGF